MAKFALVRAQQGKKTKQSKTTTRTGAGRGVTSKNIWPDDGQAKRRGPRGGSRATLGAVTGGSKGSASRSKHGKGK